MKTIFIKRWITAFVALLLMATGVMAQDSYTIKAQNYIQQYKALAVAEQQRTGVPAAIILGQGILETEAGCSVLATDANNHFGIKCRKEWTGETFSHTDDAPDECFRKYSCAKDSYVDHSDYLKNSARYAALFKLSQTDYAAWAYGLKKCGYATNPRYAPQLIKIIEDFHLQEYTYAALNHDIFEDGGDAVAADEPVKETPKLVAAATPKPVGKPAVARTAEAAKKTAPDGDKPVYTTSVKPLPATVPNEIFSMNGLQAVHATKGQSLLTYAVRYGLRYAYMLEINDLPDAPLPSDMNIYLEQKNSTGSHPTHPVKQGETLLAVSQMEGIQLRKLMALNHMNWGEQPVAGSVLQLQQYTLEKPRVTNQNLAVNMQSPPPDLTKQDEPEEKHKGRHKSKIKVQEYTATVSRTAEKVGAATAKKVSEVTTNGIKSVKELFKSKEQQPRTATPSPTAPKQISAAQLAREDSIATAINTGGGTPSEQTDNEPVAQANNEPIARRNSAPATITPPETTDNTPATEMTPVADNVPAPAREEIEMPTSQRPIEEMAYNTVLVMSPMVTVMQDTEYRAPAGVPVPVAEKPEVPQPAIQKPKPQQVAEKRVQPAPVTPQPTVAVQPEKKPEPVQAEEQKMPAREAADDEQAYTKEPEIAPAVQAAEKKKTEADNKPAAPVQVAEKKPVPEVATATSTQPVDNKMKAPSQTAPVQPMAPETAKATPAPAEKKEEPKPYNRPVPVPRPGNRPADDDYIVIDRKPKPAANTTNPIVNSAAATPVMAQPKPVVTTPVTEEKPLVKQLVAEQPVATPPVAEKPVAVTPAVAEKPIIEKPVAEKPVVVSPPIIEKPIIEKPIIEKPEDTTSENEDGSPGPTDELAKLKAELDKVVYSSKSKPAKPVKQTPKADNRMAVKPVVEAPKPVAEAVKPVAEAPKPVGPAPDVVAAPAATPQTITPAPPNADKDADKFYIVKTGDTAYGVAKRNNITMRQLINWNNMDFDEIKVGQRLRVKE